MTDRIAPATDPCWADPEYRTARLRGLIALYGLTQKDISKLTGGGKSVVLHWMSGKHKIIPTVVLRCMMYDLMSGHHNEG